MEEQQTLHPILQELHELCFAFENGKLFDREDFARMQNIQSMCN